MVRYRGLLGGGVLLGLLVLAAAGQADEAAAVRAVEKLGGKVTVDAKRPGKPVVVVIFRGRKVTDAGLKELKELKGLQKLYLLGTKVTDAGLKELKEFQSLQTLGLSMTAITDAGLNELRATNKMRQSAWYSHFYLSGSILSSKEVLSWPSRLSPMNSGLCCNP